MCYNLGMNDKTSKIIGITAFFFGIAILAAVAWFVFTILLGEDSVATELLNNNKVPLANVLASWAVNVLLKVIMLIFMTAAGSIIADKGIKLCFPPSKK